MKLIRLEAKGFKSFGDKITLGFDEGVTSVVGPNGCGKSNVVDAIRWVLGEQSTRALRSEKMENIIFNGSQNRKAGNLAEVSLTFDNTRGVLATDFTELTITRKLYRSGESEYRLNNTLCRLKDITDLFLDTGIGADSYAIIELRMVEELISNKEGSRRALFEEAAGISKYKVRKKQTFVKLKETADDLTRVEDMLYEMERNLRALESQARRTERYYKLKDEYQRLSLEFAGLRISSLNSSLKNLELEKTAHVESNLAGQTLVDSRGARLEELKLQSLNAEKALIAKQKEDTELRLMIQAFENRRKTNKDALDGLRETQKRLELEIEKDNGKLFDKQEIIENLKRQSFTVSERLCLLDSELVALKLTADQAGAETGSEQSLALSLQKEQHLTNNAIREAENILFRIQVKVDSLQGDLRRIDEDSGLRINELKDTAQKISKIQTALDQGSGDIKLIIEKEQNLSKQLDDVLARLETLRDTLQHESRALDSRSNEFKLTKSIVDNLEGFPESIRFLKKNAAWLEGKPMLSDIIFCQERYRVPIENYLEPWLNHYVVETAGQALDAVQLLNASEKGRAGFFILSAYTQPQKETTRQVTLGNDELKLVSAVSILETEPVYRSLLEHLFEGVYLQLEGPLPSQALSHIFDNDSIVYVLDEAGHFSISEKKVAGGSVGLFEGKRLGRKKNLEILQGQVEEGRQKVSTLSKELEDCQVKLRLLRAEKGALNIKPQRDLVDSLRVKLGQLEGVVKNNESFIETNRTRKTELITAKNLLEVQLKEQRPKLEESKAQNIVRAKELSKILQIVAQKEERHKKLVAAYNDKNIVNYQEKSRLQVLAKDLEYNLADSASISERLTKAGNELVFACEGIALQIQAATYSEEEALSIYHQIEDAKKALASADAEYFEIKGSVAELERELQELRKNREQTQTLLYAVNEKASGIHLEFAALKERLSIEFGLAVEEITPSAGTNDSPIAALTERNEKLRNQLDAFGAINPLALEAFKEMDSRYTFINTQKADLIEAKSSLMETIKEIDDTANSKFLACFEQIRGNFIGVFRSLFNDEDACDLILSDPSNALECEIEILARPKGKRPLTINQLSGGEKTLTAIALLFSLYLLKPAPFCIFDEVDAPLDDTNIDKFNTIIRKFSSTSQFIVVSHNKRTIACSDVIYGITMTEPGISRVVPVDLRNVSYPADAEPA